MFCNKCGTQVPTGTTFCPSCGQKIDAPSIPTTAPQTYGRGAMNAPNVPGYAAGPVPTTHTYNSNAAYGNQVNRVQPHSTNLNSDYFISQCKVLAPVILAAFAIAMSRLSWYTYSYTILDKEYNFSIDLMTVMLDNKSVLSGIPGIVTLLAWCLLIAIVATFISTIIIYTTKGANQIPFLGSLILLAAISFIAIITAIITEKLSPTPYVFLCLISSVGAFVLVIIDHGYRYSKYFA